MQTKFLHVESTRCCEERPVQIRYGSPRDPGQRSVLSHTHTWRCWGSPVPVELLQPRGKEGHSPRHGGHLYCGCWQSLTVTPTRVLLQGFWCLGGIRFKPGPSNLLTWSCETAAICRSHGSGFACKCHSFGMQVMGLVQTMLSRKSLSSEDKGLVLFSRDI